MNNNIEILKHTSKYKDFQQLNAEYDIFTRVLTRSEIDSLRKEYPEYKLFPFILNKVESITLISRVLMEKGYPKLKAYIDGETGKILHIFLVM
jgi:hypothetical protein